MKKMRESQIEPQQSEENPSPVKKPKEESAAEADRALTVVAKKLSKTLSVSATVNELIQQATDEKNLALLFAGESAPSPTPMRRRIRLANQVAIGWAAWV